MKKPHEQQWKWDAMSEMVVDEHGRVVSTPANLYDEEVQAIGWLTAAAPDLAQALLQLRDYAAGFEAWTSEPQVFSAATAALRKARVLP